MPRKGEFLLSGKEEAIREAYCNGSSISKIASEIGCSYTAVRSVLQGELRSPADGTRLRFQSPLHEMSADAWNALYWGDELPGVELLASRFEVSAGLIRKLLVNCGVRLRTLGEQVSADFKQGRRNSDHLEPGLEIRRHIGRTHGVNNFRQFNAGHLAFRRKVRKRASINCSATNRANGKRPVVPCSWCAKPFETTRGKGARSVHCCSRACAAKYCGWARTVEKTPCRPLIVQKLRELTEQRYAPLLVHTDKRTSRIMRSAPTDEMLRKVAPEIGARDAEIEAVIDQCLDEMTSEQAA